MEKSTFYAAARMGSASLIISDPRREFQSSFPSVLLLCRVFFLLPCVKASLLLLILNLFSINPDVSNSELGPLLSAFSATIRKSIGDKGLRMVGESFSGFDSYSHFEKSVFLLERLGRVYLFLRQQLGAKEIVAEGAFLQRQ